MRKLLFLASMAVGCAPSNYYYSFDLTDPGAHNLSKPGERDTIEDGDVKAEILVDPTSFQSILLDVTNKTDQPLGVQWDQISITGPDQISLPLRPDTGLGWVDPLRKVVARLIPFSLPAVGNAATAYNQTKFELSVPMVVRGQPRQYRYHLIATVQKL